MTKAATKAQRRRNKRAKAQTVTLAGETRPTRPERRGGARSETQEAVMRTVLNARVRHGAPPDKARDPQWGDDMGKCIMALEQARAPELWDAWTHLARTRHTFLAICIGRPAGPKNATIAVQPEPCEADATKRPDLRTEDERAADAQQAWYAWLVRLGKLGRIEFRAIWAAIDGDMIWADGRPTALGRHAVEALVAMVDAVKREVR